MTIQSLQVLSCVQDGEEVGVLIERLHKHVADMGLQEIADFRAYFEAGGYSPSSLADADDDCDHADDGGDSNRDGELTAGEIFALLGSDAFGRFECSHGEMQALFSRLDVDRSGTISYPEFLCILPDTIRTQLKELERRQRLDRLYEESMNDDDSVSMSDSMPSSLADSIASASGVTRAQGNFYRKGAIGVSAKSILKGGWAR